MTPLVRLFRTTAFKISLVYLLVTSIGAVFVLFSVGYNVSTLIAEQVRQTIETDVTGLSEQYSEGGIQRVYDIVEQRIKVPGAGLYLLTTPAGEPIIGNLSSLPAGILDQRGIVETHYRVKGERRRALARVLALSGGFRLLVGHDLAEGDNLRPLLWHALLTSLAWLTAIGTIGGLLVARRVLRRVDRINADARRIVEGDLSGRLSLAGSGDELDRLVVNLNAMLERISTLVAGLKEVSDNVAHDLKTPLTRLRNRAEEALRVDRSAEDYRRVIEKVIEDADGMIRIFNALLMIARAEAGAGREGMRDFDVAEVASDVGELYEPVAEDNDIAFEGHIDRNLFIHGSRELIGQALANLVDNAMKYGVGTSERPAAKRAVTLSAMRRGAVIEIVVADCGPGIASTDRERVAQRFVRLENSRSMPGTGLGLSLVAAVVGLHNGTMKLEDNTPGLRIVIELPAVRVTQALLTGPESARATEPSGA